MVRCKRHFILILSVCCAVSIFLLCSKYPETYINGNCNRSNDFANGTKAKPIVCSADGGKFMQCLSDGQEIYFPFENFLKNRFELSGKMVKGLGERSHFELRTSFARLKTPETFLGYDPFGPFGQFAFYSVETRDRVRCISAKSGIPMSTQWSSKPYYYPIQIAQFALQHYSRYKTNVPPKNYSFTEKNVQWRLEEGSQADSKTDPVDEEFSIHVSAPESIDGAKLKLLPDTTMVVIMFDWNPTPGASFSISVEVSQATYEIHYIQKDDDRCVWSESSHKIFYALGEASGNTSWRKVNRNILVDLDRGLLTQLKVRKNGSALRPGDAMPMWLSFRGESSIKNIRQQSSCNLENFLVSAKWFLLNQDSDGGWNVPIKRRVVNDRLSLPSGWHSAMAQGQALSVLTRAYKLLNDSAYLDAAGKALKIFEMGASEGGVSNRIFGNVWYEEYPTVPGTYVLNGFMYALIGLYDFSQTPSALTTKAKELFNEGIRSLELILPLFDTGSGSMYDLRHFTLKLAPNLARWDYHAVHIYLLKWLSGITKINYFNEVADRWIDYARGKKAKHN